MNIQNSSTPGHPALHNWNKTTHSSTILMNLMDQFLKTNSPSDQTTSTYLWKDCQTPTNLNYYGNNPKQRSYGRNLKASHQLNWISTYQNLILQKILFQLKTTWVGGTTLFKFQALQLHKKIAACHSYFLRKNATIWTNTTNS